VALGNTVKHPALIMGFSDTFAVIGVVLAIAAVTLLFARKVKSGVAGGAAWVQRPIRPRHSLAIRPGFFLISANVA
jgi:hypothetical protein